MLLAALLCWAAISARADDAPASRELACRVVDEAGLPVRGVVVRLGGLERDAPNFELDEDRIDREPGWKFTTDGEGRFTARFGQFYPSRHSESGGAFAGPGYGEFHFVVQKAGFAGGVSREILNLDEEARDRLQAEAYAPRGSSWDNQEWRRGEFASLLLRDDQASREPLVIVLKRGLEVRGRMVDTAGRPVRGEGVGLALDLHYGSHTGAGGLIFPQGATTDRHGRFLLRHVYPNVFTLEAAGGYDAAPYWIKTRVRDRWVDRIEDEITPRLGDEREPSDYEKVIELCFVVSRRALYRYFGRVTDENGHPLVRTAVTVRNVSHLPVRTWGESHRPGQITRTDADGNYSLRVGTRFVDGIWVRTDTRYGGIDAQPLEPGRHDFVAGPKKPGD